MLRIRLKLLFIRSAALHGRGKPLPYGFCFGAVRDSQRAAGVVRPYRKKDPLGGSFFIDFISPDPDTGT